MSTERKLLIMRANVVKYLPKSTYIVDRPIRIVVAADIKAPKTTT
nr:hypothetical protein [uncultured Methanolobus sp.]